MQTAKLRQAFPDWKNYQQALILTRKATKPLTLFFVERMLDCIESLASAHKP